MVGGCVLRSTCRSMRCQWLRRGVQLTPCARSQASCDVMCIESAMVGGHVLRSTCRSMRCQWLRRGVQLAPCAPSQVSCCFPVHGKLNPSSSTLSNTGRLRARLMPFQHAPLPWAM